MFLLVMFLGVLIHAKADEKYSPDINGLYEASLIITCNATQNVEGKVLFTVLNVLKNTSQKLVKPNASIQFHRPRYGVLGGYGNHSFAGDFVVYLRLYKGEWFCYGGSQQVHELKEGKIPFTLCGKTFIYTPEQYRRLKKHFYTTFYKEDGMVYRAYMTEAKYRKLPEPEEALLHMYTCPNNIGRYYAHQMILEPPIEEVVEEPMEVKEDTTIIFVSEDPPIFPGGEQALYEYLKQSVGEIMMKNEQNIEGKIYVQFVIEKDGMVTNSKVVRGINKELDQEILKVIQSMPNWIPAKERGKEVRMYYVLPIRIEL